MKRKNLESRIVAAILAGVLTVSLTACGGSSTASSTDSTAESSSSENTASEAETSEDAAAAETTETTVIYAGTAGSPAPYVTTDENNELTGYDIAVLKEVFNRLPQYDLEFQLSDFASVLTGMTAGTCQMAVNNWGYTKERAENYYYSYPYDAKPYWFVQRSDDEPLTSFQDAADRGYTIECFTGQIATVAVENWNTEHPDSQINIQYTEAELPAVYEHIVDGVSDFRIEDAPAYNLLADSYGFDLQGVPISDEDTKQITSTLSSYFLFPKSEEGAALRDEVDAVVKEMFEDGTLADLQQEYLGINYLPDASEYESTLN
jgi:polar amino acid transport system substrate-binding protein